MNQLLSAVFTSLRNLFGFQPAYFELPAEEVHRRHVEEAIMQRYRDQIAADSDADANREIEICDPRGVRRSRGTQSG